MKFDVCEIAMQSECPLMGKVPVKFKVHISPLAPGVRSVYYNLKLVINVCQSINLFYTS